MLVFLTFWTLIGITVSDRLRSGILAQKSRFDWIIDTIGLLIQGFLIPAIQIVVLNRFCSYLMPQAAGCLTLNPVLAFGLSFIAVDYLYYWNHRGLHSKWLWRSHLVHHTVTQMDVLGTSRNTIWTSFVIVYVWVHGLFIYLLSDPSWYILGVSLTSALDLWRHSGLWVSERSHIYRIISLILILPQDHAWHHAAEITNCNYGANFKLWDVIHQTYYSASEFPERLGVESNLSLMRRLFLP
ncbi:sterol desaturase family protein [Merismopedia glauca]|uniref:Sterol desaturase family protein n=1 Tax=Merismopedia glauca CCAP 1448/3 TaxID=1296344 RepID=A0A2T1C230_9CYAN|nr:sterol desaturase family protein [Merismopedia glauca]PSB02173.1 sterol desaturase family protein [Merismopedia glauca CCAP 1448/3]